MRILTQAEASALLQAQGVKSDREADAILMAFDRSKPLYENQYYPGDTLYQFIRLTSATTPTLNRGSWFGIAGITTQGVAIMDGLAGRKLHKFQVLFPFSALEGTAAQLSVNWQYEIGGPGGSTQIYVPHMHAGKIHALGPAN